MSGEVEATLAQRMEESGGSGGIGQTIARAATGAEVGLTLGYLAQKVVGQYDVALIGPTREPRLLFVAPNLSAAQQRLDVDRELFLSWIALHETTHAVQFAAVPWLRPHLGAIASELFEGAALEISPSDLLGKLTSVKPRELLDTIKSGQLASLFLNQDQQRLVDRLMATMTVVEGYAEHVMDAVGDSLDPGYAELRRRLEQRPRAPRPARRDRLQAARAGDEDVPVPARQGVLRRRRRAGRHPRAERRLAGRRLAAHHPGAG